MLSVATGSTACATAYILWKDSFTVPMVIDLLNKRFHNYCAMHPDRGEADELHNVDFMDILKRGEAILDIAPLGKGGKVKGIEVDLSPSTSHEVIANPQRYTYPACAITQRFAALMTLADFPCFLTPECTTATIMTNAVAVAPRQAGRARAVLQGLRDLHADQEERPHGDRSRHRRQGLLPVERGRLRREIGSPV